MTIKDLEKGTRFLVSKVILPRETGKRLADMGFTRGAEGIIIRSALLGDPIQVKILGYNVCIRRAEAAGIQVEVIPGNDSEENAGKTHMHHGHGWHWRHRAGHQEGT